MCSSDLQYQRGWHHHCSCIRHSCLEKLKWHAKKRMASSSVHALLIHIKATYSSAVTFVSAVIDLRTGGLRQPWENWELWNRTRFNWDSKKKEYLRRQTWSWTWQILSRPLHGCILHKPSTPPGSIDYWTTSNVIITNRKSTSLQVKTPCRHSSEQLVGIWSRQKTAKKVWEQKSGRKIGKELKSYLWKHIFRDFEGLLFLLAASTVKEIQHKSLDQQWYLVLQL